MFYWINAKEISFFRFIAGSLLLGFTSLFIFYNQNSSQIILSQIARLAIICLVIPLVLSGLLRIFFPFNEKTSFILFIVCVAFFSYGHINNLLFASSFAELAKHRILVPLSVVIYLCLILVVVKKTETLSANINRITRLVFLVLMVFNLGQIFFGLFAQSTEKIDNIIKYPLPELSETEQAKLPDIYWFIIDGYERKDALQDHYGLDNSKFLKELEDRSFILPKCTLSNYPVTALSLSTTLDLDYVENITTKQLTRKDLLRYDIFHEILMNNQVEEILHQYKYKTVAFETGYEFTELTNSDVYYQLRDNSVASIITHPGFSSIEETYLRTTGFQGLFDMPTKLKRTIFSFISDSSREKYNLVEFGFQKITEVPDITGKKFVFAHFLSTHEPFVQNPDGSYEFYKDTKTGYINAIVATNDRMLVIIDEIISKSKIPPVIVIQGDHAYDSKDKTKILNAYYLPGVQSNALPQDISPVNTFRLILDNYLGIDLPLLENRSYITPDKRLPTAFSLVQPSCFK